MNGIDWYEAKAALEWQYELGVTEVMSDSPINRFELPQEAPKPKAKKPTPKPSAPEPSAPEPATARVDPVAAAQQAAASAADLPALQAAIAHYTHCDLKKGARSLVFSDGVPMARVMVIGEAPGREEDLQGKPFVGAAGQLFDKMFADIGLSRTENLYISNILPWRPPQNRDPEPDEVAIMMPFVLRHIELAAPEILVLMGNHSCNAILGKRGITRLRGNWDAATGRPVLPMLHPAYLLRQPLAKRDTWADLLSLKAKLEKGA